MSLSISKLMDLVGDNNKEKDLIGDRNPDIPFRYNKIKGVKGMKIKGNNHNYNPSELDQFNEVMKQSAAKRYDMSGLHLDLKQKKGTQPIFQEMEGWIDPATRRRAYDPNHAPPFDYAIGGAFQKFGTDKDETTSHDNVSLIQMAHANYNKWLNRYNVPSIPVTIQK